MQELMRWVKCRRDTIPEEFDWGDWKENFKMVCGEQEYDDSYLEMLELLYLEIIASCYLLPPRDDVNEEKKINEESG